MPSRQNHHLKRPDRPERNHGDKARIGLHHALGRFFFEGEVVAQKDRLLFREVHLLAGEFCNNLIGDRPAGPDLTMRMGIAGPHHRAAVLEDLHVVDVIAST